MSASIRITQKLLIRTPRISDSVVMRWAERFAFIKISQLLLLFVVWAFSRRILKL